MQTVMITLRDQGGRFAYDLELPYDQEAQLLAPQVVQALHAYNRRLELSGTEQLYVPRERRILAPNETLAQVGVRNGDYLVLTR